MGIFDDYDIDIDEVKESSFDVADGTYRFEIAEAEVLDGTENKPDDTFFIIDYQLEDENGDSVGQKREWFTLAQSGEQTKRTKQSLSFLKSRLIGLGLKGAQLSEFDGSELVGKTGVLSLKSTPSKDRKSTFQNIRNVRLEESDEEPEVEAKKPAAKKTAAKPAAKAAPKPKPKAEEPEESGDDDDDNPFG